jgi:hypothetical protein
MGAKLKSKKHLQNTFFDFLSRFLRIWLQSLQKVLIWPQKFFFSKNSIWVSKNAEFHADFESVEKVVKKCTKKTLQAKQVWQTWVKVKKVHISVTFLLITFFVYFFKTFSTDSKSAWNSAFVDTHLEFFDTKMVFALFSTFCTLWLQMRRKRLEKTENLFYECVSEF